MQSRYALRFESGERRGEIVTLSGTSLSFGRRPGNGVQILDPSVSGKHAELLVDDEGPLLRDLGSTNGTKVGPDRISERRLAHGDEVTFGNVRMTFFDRKIDSPPVEVNAAAPTAVEQPAAPAATTEAAGEGMRTISADKLARSGKRSLVAFGGVLILAAGGAAAWYFLRPKAGGATLAHRAIEPVAGDLLASGYSFETEQGAGTWEPLESAPATFSVDRSARRSGESGLRADLEAQQWAEQRSPEVSLSGGRSLRARGWVKTEEGARARLGILFTSSAGAAAPATAWSEWQSSADEFAAVELSAEVPPVYDRARALISARAEASPGTVLADDVSLLTATGAAAEIAAVGDVQVFPLGQPPRSAVLFKIDHALATQIAIDAGGEPAPMSIRTEASGVRLESSGTGPHRIALRVEPAQLAQGLATTGQGGYRTHQVEFERANATNVLIGTGRDLVRLELPAPATVRGRPDGDGFRIEADLAGTPSALLQLSFKDERIAAEALARDAREAEKQDEIGRSIAAWSRLLDELPFDVALVREAEASRARGVQRGLEEVQRLQLEVERARFFRLPDLFRQSEKAIAAVAQRYHQSEVEIEAKKLAASVAVDLEGLEKDLDLVEARRLASILRALEAQKMTALAARVRETLREKFGVEDGGTALLAQPPRPVSATPQSPATTEGKD